LFEKYSPIIREVNNLINDFNNFLSDGYKLNHISKNNPNTYTKDLDKPWGKQGWPSKDDYGVYFLCGYQEDDKDKIGVYIGKASLKFMGHRMWSHLKPYRETGIYKRGNFIIQVMLAIPIKDEETRCIASALEEYLITHGLGTIQLLNGTGNRNK